MSTTLWLNSPRGTLAQEGAALAEHGDALQVDGGRPSGGAGAGFWAANKGLTCG